MPATKLTFPITAGKYKGRRLQLPSSKATRPTKAIIRGSVFDTLQFDIIGEVFVEVFGGSGSMGLEALSRGALDVYFFEKDREALKILEKNCAALDPGHTHVRAGDSFALYPELMAQLQREGKRAFIYLDPPFAIREGMEDIYEKVTEMIVQTPPEVIHKIIIEHMSSVSFPATIGPFVQQKCKKFGKTSLSYYTLA